LRKDTAKSSAVEGSRRRGGKECGKVPQTGIVREKKNFLRKKGAVINDEHLRQMAGGGGEASTPLMRQIDLGATGRISSEPGTSRIKDRPP